MKIDHVNIVVKDLETAKKFFIGLGFAQVKEGKLEGEWIDALTGLTHVKARYVKLAFPGDNTKLELLTYISPPGFSEPNIGKPNQVGFRHMAIEVENIDRLVEDLKQKGVKFLSDIQTDNVNKRMCYFYGPEGILLEIAEYKNKI